MANLKVGIVGLPNVGKSTLFNLITKKQVPAQNYPFCTIDPNIGIVQVQDNRFEELVELVQPKSQVPAVVEFVDIAGLVEGAHKGEGLGNQFLANIREVGVILHVVRAFEDENIKHVSDKIDPLDDIDTVETELILKDLETLQKFLIKQEKFARADKKESLWFEELKKIQAGLEQGKKAETIETSKDFANKRKALSLLTDKKMIYLINTNDVSNIDDALKEFLGVHEYFEINLKLLQELEAMESGEREEYIKELEITVQGLEELIFNCYRVLGLITFFTAGEKEVRAWELRHGAKAPEAAGVIHTDFEKNFIAADIVSFEDFLSTGGWKGAAEKGRVRLEGRDYEIKDGDVIVFKHGAA